MSGQWLAHARRHPYRSAAGIDWLWPIACATGFLILCWLLRAFVADDAWITVRYAESLAGGYGFVWNPGGPRVEGFSDPLLVGAEALASALGLSGLGVARVIGVACGMALVALIHFEATPVLGRTASRAGMALTALFPPIALWAVGGLETLAAALATTAGVLSLCRTQMRRRDAVVAAVALSALPWLRPEGLLVGLAVVLAAESSSILRGPRRAATLRLMRVAGPILASQALLELARLTVYGHLLPNSVLYKTGAGGTFDVLLTFAAIGAPVMLAGAAGVVVARGRQYLLAVPPAVYLVGSVGTLDSANAFARFFLPTWPQWALLAGLAVAATRRRMDGAGRSSAFGLTAVLSILVVAGLVESPAVAQFSERYASCKQEARRGAAGWLRAHTSPDTMFSISDAGLVPARAGGRTAIDQFMLNDPSIQETGPRAVTQRVAAVYDRRPDVLVLASRYPGRFAGLYPTDRAMTRDRRFAGYHLATVARGAGDGCGYHLFLYRRTARPAT